VSGKVLARLAAGAAALLLATAAAAGPARVILVRPTHLDPIAAETLIRLQAELVAAGFEVVLADSGASHAHEATAASAVVTLVDAGGGTAEVWIADPASPATQAHPIHAGAGGESSRAAALAIRTVEILRAGLLDRRAASLRRRSAEAQLDDSADLIDAAPPAPPRAGRALLQGPSLELGLAAIYGLGDTAGRLAPVLRFAYGSEMGLAARLTLLGTPTDQAGLVEAAYGFCRRWRAVAPVLSLGAGGSHTHLDDTATPRFPRLRSEAWGGVLSAGAGFAARVTDRAALLVDAHAWLVQVGPGALVGAAPAGNGPRAMATASLGVVTGF
jgi:hypothetical protein